MKRLLVLALSVLIGLFAFVACKGDEGSSTPNLGVKYDITYYAVLDGEKQAVPEQAKVENATYPIEYEKGKETFVPNLNVSYSITVGSANGKVVFGGWYTDEACTQAFAGITTATTGDVTLYAKLTTEITYTECTITYKMVVGNEVVDLLEEMKIENGDYPTKYYEGKSILNVSNLKKEFWASSYSQYEFKGWYTTSSCETAFTGVTVETTGDIIVYAKVSYSLWSPNV